MRSEKIDAIGYQQFSKKSDKGNTFNTAYSKSHSLPKVSNFSSS